MQGGGRQPMIVDKQIVAMRGRPSGRKDNSIEQRLESNNKGVCNALTSVQKDNLLLETLKIKQATKDGYIECKVGGGGRSEFP